MDKKREDGKSLSGVAQKAKLGVVESLRQMAEDAMKDRGLKKVSVASDSAEGLKHGLEMAKDQVAGMASDHKAPDSEDETGEIESPEDESEDLEDAEYGKAHGSDELQSGHGSTGDDRLQATTDDEDDEEEAHEDTDHSDDEDEASIDAKLAALMEKKKKYKK